MTAGIRSHAAGTGQPSQRHPLERQSTGTKLAVLAVILFMGVRVPAAFVYESSAEFLTSGDFNGDGVPDALVVDKATGNARVAFDDGTGQLTWTAPVPTGADAPTGIATGRFLTTTRDALAVTAPGLNRLLVVDLISPTLLPTNLYPAGIGPHALAALRAPFGTPLSYHAILASSSGNNSNAERADLLTLNAGVGTSAAAFQPGAPFERLNALDLAPSGPSYVMGMLRGPTDALQVWRLTPANAPVRILSRGDLPPGSEYAVGRFFGETLPRLVIYRPGGVQITFQSLVQSVDGLGLGETRTFTVPSPLRRVYYAELSGAGILVIHFDDGVRGARPPSGGGAGLEYTQDFAPSAGFAFTGVVPLSDGKFALLSSSAGDDTAARAQVFRWNGASFGQVGGVSDIPAATSGQTRATIWMFGAEPFVNRDPGFLFSAAVPDWTTNVSNVAGTLLIRRQLDGGAASGLNGSSLTNLPASGASFGVPNQYHPAISLFSYNSAASLEPVRIRISPPPGAYPAPIAVSLTVGSPGLDIPFYRLDDGAFRVGAAGIVVTNDVTIRYYATNISSRLRSRLYSARYTFGRPTPADPISDPTITSNLPPVTPSPSTNNPPLSIHGTVFYGRYGGGNLGTIWAINLDGSNDRYITTGARPRVSPNGRYLAFEREGSPFTSQGNLWMRDLVTGGEWRLFSNNDFIIGFNWNNDSSSLYFDYGCGLWRTGTNGGPTALPMVNDCSDEAPAVNPRDGRVAFHNRSLNTAVRGLYVTDPGGGVRRRLPIPGYATWPAWSPDGRQIAFADSPIDGVLNNGPDLFVVNPDGTGLYPITSLGGVNGFLTGAQWAPNADALVAAGSIFNTNGLWVIPLTADRTACASAPIRLPTTPGDWIDFAGSVVAAARRPDLFIRRDPGEVVIYWRQTLTESVLESSSELGPAANWSPIAGPYPVVDLYHEVHLTEAELAGAAYFRLRVGE